MKTVSKGKLKGRMLEYFRQVELTGEPLIVTDRGREVLEVGPVGKEMSTAGAIRKVRAQLFGDLPHPSKRRIRRPDTHVVLRCGRTRK